ncbi:unnamed protein product, partial [Symbiodinium sp. CCMP2456]
MAFMAFSSDASTHPDIPNLFPSEEDKKDMEVTAYEKAYWPCHVRARVLQNSVEGTILLEGLGCDDEAFVALQSLLATPGGQQRSMEHLGLDLLPQFLQDSPHSQLRQRAVRQPGFYRHPFPENLVIQACRSA